MRLPALCGELTREDAQKLREVSVTQQQEVMGSVSTVIGQRQRTLTHPGKLEKLLTLKEQNEFELIPSPKKRSKNLERPDNIRALENLFGTPFEVPNRTSAKRLIPIKSLMKKFVSPTRGATHCFMILIIGTSFN